ncbi:probable disease resistance protein At1g61300 [Prosopis cineraria]|uniref:probable disease resistance protein At1g61300 n=1 Tax=Prosopis cineraria TaxID=364024 RepID=UPI00240F3AA6|nr:probable disease resistance protein At1g61300 [Prosopis cineraria]
MHTKVDDLTAEGQRFGKDFPMTHKPPHKRIGQIPLDETVGLDLIFEKVWNSIETDKVGVIGLCGIGGVGKTTLLKKINNELGKRRPDFFVISVVVSKEPNLDRIMDNIRKSVGIGNSTWNSCNNQEEKSSKIWGVLKQKKFVLLLDDVWEQLDLNLVGVPHLQETNLESKVLFTTRLKDVCAKMQAQISFEVELLKEKEALELFHKKVGEKTLNSHRRIKFLAKEMCKECKGLPLALIVVGSAMAGVNNVEAWECTKSNLTSSSWTTSNLEMKVFSILKLSYDQLPDDDHRNCFLYCALYPEDYEIRVSDIIDKWIGEGFLCENMTKSIQDMCNYGESVIAKLKFCCLLETVEDDIVVRHSIKMHDMIRDMALWLASDQEKKMKKVLVQRDAMTMSHNDDVEKWKIVERISIMGAGEGWHVPSMHYPNLKTLLARECKINGLQNIKCMSQLKCLELNVKEIYDPIEISNLVLLEYLSLTSYGSKVPKELKNLKKLKLFNLLLPEASIASIPLEVISSLQQLRVLRVYCSVSVRGDSKEEGEFLEEVESLPKIEELNFDIETNNGLSKVVGSAKLQGCISTLRLEGSGIIIKMPLLLACMSKMKHLRQFSMSSLGKLEDSSLHDVCHLTMLRSVNIVGCDSIMHATWLKYAPLLQTLIIKDCSSMEQVIKEEATKDDQNVDSPVFSSLVELYLFELPKLKSIHSTHLSLPCLKSIFIADCPILKELPLSSNSAKYESMTILGEEDWWNNLEWDHDPAAKHKFQSKFRSSLVDEIPEANRLSFNCADLDFGAQYVANVLCYLGLDYAPANFFND